VAHWVEHLTLGFSSGLMGHEIQLCVWAHGPVGVSLRFSPSPSVPPQLMHAHSLSLSLSHSHSEINKSLKTPNYSIVSKTRNEIWWEREKEINNY